jgi:hypothetical protein
VRSLIEKPNDSQNIWRIEKKMRIFAPTKERNP